MLIYSHVTTSFRIPSSILSHVALLPFLYKPTEMRVVIGFSRWCCIMEMERLAIDEQDEEDIGSPSSSESTVNSSATSSSDFKEDATSSDSKNKNKKKSPLYQMSDLMEELPIKRGLSRCFNGKSKSFASLSNVRCLEDLVKPKQEIRTTCRKRIKALKNSYNGDLDLPTTKYCLPPIRDICCSRTIIKKPFSMGLKRLHHHHHHHGFLLGSRPPIHQHAGSSNLSGRALLFT